jgi:hypothetical protein
LPADARWIDHSGLHHVLLIQTPATPHARAHEQLFWNRSLDDVLFFGRASLIDAFGSRRVSTDATGQLVSGGKVVRAPLAISNFAIRMQLRNAVRVAHGADYDLWRPAGTPRVALFVGGLYADSWLSSAGHLTVWADRGTHVRGTLKLRFWLPKQTERTVVQLEGPGFKRNVAVQPNSERKLVVPVAGGRSWRLSFRTGRPGYLADGRPISVKAAMPVFTSAP